MDRRKIMAAVAAVTGGLFFSRRSAQADTTEASKPSVPRVVYHLSDMDKALFVLGNMKNHIKGMGGPDKVTLAIVVHGPPLSAFRADSKDDVTAGMRQLNDEGVKFFACINTMRAMKLTLADLEPGFGVADKGGVVKLAELQADGWLYLRP